MKITEQTRAHAKETLFGPYKLIDLTQIDDEQLKEQLWLGIMMRTMKHIWDKDIFPFLKETIKRSTNY